ncbi:hypothetical protein GQ472_06305 [archaeon]|nr:hypothetical protein [archaeon]
MNEKKLSGYNKVKHNVRRHHRMRKKVDDKLPPWKKSWNCFNETRLGFIEHSVEKAIPWLVILLLFIILGEFSGYLNVFHWVWLEHVTEFFHSNAKLIHTIDSVIISFFVVDLYFNFFKKRTVWIFLKTSILDIIAIAPFGLLFRVAGLGEAQSIIHVTSDIEKNAARVLHEGEIATKIVRMEEAAKIQRVNKLTKTLARMPRLFRLHRLSTFFRKKK